MNPNILFGMTLGLVDEGTNEQLIPYEDNMVIFVGDVGRAIYIKN